MFDMNTTHVGISVPLRRCLVVILLYGNSHQLPAALFDLNLENSLLQPFFSGSHQPDKDEVSLSQWLSTVERA